MSILEEYLRIEAVKRSIKNPRFYYAEYNIDTGEVIYKRKKWYEWFSKEPKVIVIIEQLVEEDYAVISSDDGE